MYNKSSSITLQKLLMESRNIHCISYKYSLYKVKYCESTIMY